MVDISPTGDAPRLREEDVMDRLRARRIGWRVMLVPAVLLCSLIAAPASLAKPARGHRGATRYARAAHACPRPKPGRATCFALVRVPVSAAAAAQPGVRPFRVGDGALESGPAGGLTPEQIATAYGFKGAGSGEGQTVAVVDAYDDPNIEADLGAFDTYYGIAPCTKANGCFEKVGQTGKANVLPKADKEGWSVEISLDVEMVHSTCPKCHVLLVEANNPEFSNLAVAVNEAVKLGATEVSNSYGGPEGSLGSTEKAAYSHPGVVIAAATGDEGYNDWTYINPLEEVEGEYREYLELLKKEADRPNMPASLPSVVAVGGTSLYLTEEGKREAETVWNGNGPLDEAEFEGTTGGGCSTMFTAPPWQQSAPGYGATGCGGKRLTADISAVADPNTGFDIYDTDNCGPACEEYGAGEGWLTIGGTSVATPLISGLYGLAGGANGVSDPALTLYGHLGESSSLFDVTEGGNGFCDDDGQACGANAYFGLSVDCEGTTACNAAPGFDGPSGVGTPNSLALFKPLSPTAVISPPPKIFSGIAATFSAASSSDPYPGASPTYTWSWGDGTPSGNGVTPTHTYATPGQYEVTLTVSDAYGFKSAPVATKVTVVEKTAQEIKEEEEAAAKKKAEEEAAAKKAEEEAAAKKKAEEEVAATKKAEEEAAATKKAEEEAAAKKKAEAEAAARLLLATGTQEVKAFHSSLAPVPDATLASSSLQVSSSGHVTLRISCPAGRARAPAR